MMPIIHPGIVALYATDLWVMFGLLGLVVVRGVVLPTAQFEDAVFRRRWENGVSVTLVLLLLTALCMPTASTMQMADLSFAASLPLTPEVILQTHAGHVWMLRAAMLLIMAGWWWAPFARARKTPLLAAVPALICLGFCYSANSHAADHGDFTLAEMMDLLHVLAAAVWVGSLMTFTFLIFPMTGKHARHRIALCPGALQRLSTACGLALTVLAASGSYALWMHWSAHAGLFSTEYGRMLLLKLLLVAVMVLLGALNRYKLVPRLESGQQRQPLPATASLGQLKLTMTAETCLALAVLVIVAILLHGLPPDAMQM